MKIEISNKTRKVMQSNWQVQDGVIYWKGSWQDDQAVVTIEGHTVPVDVIAKLMHMDFTTIAKYGEQHAGMAGQDNPGDIEDSGDGTGESPE